MRQVLVKEDQKIVRDFIWEALTGAGYEPVSEPTEDLIAAVLDSKLANVDSFEYCQSLREKYENIAILMLTGRGQNMDQLTGLMTGADAYLTKPFSTAALLGYLEAVLNHARMQAVRLEELVSSGPFLLDTHNCKLEKFGEQIRLTRTEYDLLKLLMQNPDRDISKEELATAVWDVEETNRKIELCIRCLRIKLEEDPNQPSFIKTVWGRGYRWCG